MVHTDPYDADTDGDGILDALEFGNTTRTEVSQQLEVTEDLYIRGSLEVFRLKSDPHKIDSDADGLTDLEERKLGTDALSEDTDGDGFDDFRDERPRTDDTPPKVMLEAMGPEGYLRITDDSDVRRQDIEIKPYYEGEGWKPDWGSVYWAPTPENESEVTPYHHQYRFVTESPGGQSPNKYGVNVSDANGNTVSYLVEYQQNHVSVTKVAVLFAVSTSRTPISKTPASVGAIGAITLGIAGYAAGSVQFDVTRATDFSVSTSQPVKSWENVEVDGTNLGTITLNEGFIARTKGVTYGKGWEYIQRLPGISDPDDIAVIINNPTAIKQIGGHTLIIGDNPNGPGRITLTLKDGLLIAGTSEIPLDSPAHDEEIVLDEDYYDEHAGHQDDHLSKDQVREVVENPDEVYRGKNSRGKTVYVWVKYVNGEAHIVRGEDFDESANIPLDGIRIRSAYRDFRATIEGLKERYDLNRIWSS